MPRVPIPSRAGNAVVQGPRAPRVGQPATLAPGLQAVGNVVAGVGEQLQDSQNQRDRDAEKRAADQLIANERATAEAQKQALSDAKLAAGNAAVRYRLDTDDVLRQWDEKLAAGEIDDTQYEGKVAADLRRVGQRLATSVPEIGRPAFEQAIRTSGANNVIKVRDRLQAHRNDKRMGALVEGAADLERLAVSDLASAKKAAAGMFGPNGPYAEINGAKAAAEAGQKWKENATRAHYQRRIGDAYGNSGALQALREEVSAAADLDPMQQSAMLSSIDSRSAVLENRAIAERDRRERKAAAAAQGLRSLSEGGFPVAPDFAAEVSAATEGTEYAAEVRDMLQGAAKTAGFASKPVAEQERIVAEMTAQAASGGVDPDSAKQLERLQRVRDTSRRDFAGNAWQAAADRGQIDAVPPLDTSSIMGMVGSLQSRVNEIDAVELAAGGPVSPLQPDEATGFGQMLESLPVAERVEMLGRARQIIGPARMMALAGQVAKDDPTLAVVASAEANGLKAENGESVGALIMRGAEAIKGKQVKIDDMAGEGIQMQMREYLADAVTSPVARDAAVSAAIKVWAARQVEGDALDYEEAIETVTGRVVEWGGGKVLAPQGWSEDEFRVAVEDLSPLRITQLTGGASMFVAGQPITPAALAEQIEAVQLRQGTGNRYALQIGGALVTNESGAPVMLPLRKPERMPGFIERVFGGQ